MVFIFLCFWYFGIYFSYIYLNILLLLHTNMSSFRRKNLVETLYRNKRNRLLKWLTLFFLWASATLLLARAETVINPTISNAVSYMKQIFVTSDGTSNGTIGVVLNGSGNIWASLYCDGSGANCKDMGNVVTPAYLDAKSYVTVGQIWSLANVPAWVHNVSITSSDINRWDTTYGWWNHASAGYAKTSDLSISNWDTAYGWWNHASAGYAKTSDLSISNWDTAYSWWNHASAGYAKTSDLSISNWDTAYTQRHTHNNMSILDSITYVPEDPRYKNTDTTLSSSDSYYPTVPAVKSYVDTKVPQNISTSASPTFAGLTLNGTLDVGQINSMRQVVSLAGDMCSDPGSSNYYWTMPICLWCTSSSCTIGSDLSSVSVCRAPTAYNGGSSSSICPDVGGGWFYHVYNTSSTTRSYLNDWLSLQGSLRAIGGYASSDGSVGLTVTVNNIEHTDWGVDKLCSFVFKNGLLISTTCN